MTDNDYEAPQDEELYYKQMQKNKEPAYPGVAPEDVPQPEVVPIEYQPALQMQDHMVQKRGGSGREVFLYFYADGQYQLYQQVFQTKSQAVNFARQNLKGIRTFAGTYDEVLAFQESLWNQQKQQQQRQQRFTERVQRVEKGVKQAGAVAGRLGQGFLTPDPNTRQKTVSPYRVAHPREDYGFHQQHGFKAAPRWGPVERNTPQPQRTTRRTTRTQSSPVSGSMGMQPQPRMFLSNEERAQGYGRKVRKWR